MAFPLAITVELNLGGTWTDVSADVYQRDPVTITRGRSGESAGVDASRLDLTLNNRSGDYSPRNPTGAYFGLLGRNTPVRVSVPTTDVGHMLLVSAGDSATAGDTAGLSVTGDMDVRVDVGLDDWSVGALLAGKYESTGDHRSWALWLNTDRTVSFRWSPDGTLTNAITKTSTAAVTDPGAGVRTALRVTLDVNNTAAGNDVKFYTAATVDGSWTQLGATVTTAGVTSVFDGSASVEVGDVADLTTGGVAGVVYAFKLFADLVGTAVRASPDFTSQEGGAGSFVDAQTNTWTPGGTASLVDPSLRFCGEVSMWPPRWDTSGSDVWTPVEAAGVLRRLGQGAAKLKSTWYRTMLSADGVVAYWSCEDGDDATVLASALSGQPPMVFAGDVDTASYAGFKSSAPLPMASSRSWVGTVPVGYTATGSIAVRFLMFIPAAGTTNGAVICRIRCASGTAPRWDLVYGTGGTLRVICYDSADVQIDATTAVFAVNGRHLWVSIELVTNGANVDVTYQLWDVGDSVVNDISISTVTGRTIGTVQRVRMNATASMDDVALGHVSVQSEVTDLSDGDVADDAVGAPLRAYDGETAGNRIARLCREEGVAVRLVSDATTVMGPQLPKTVVDLLAEAADADMGILYEPRDFAGLVYRSRESMHAQTSGMGLDYAAGDLSGFDPVDDDQSVRNDITTQRVDGASARAVLETGALSVASVGRYDEEVTINVSTDGQLPDQASWRLHLGTTDEARFPRIGVNLGRTNFTSDAALTAAAQALDVGDKVTVTNPPAWLPPDDISQLVQGVTEVLGRFEWLIDANCSPASPYDVGVYDASTGVTESRYESLDCVTSEALDTTETLVDVTSSTPWSAADQPFDLYIGGERMTLTAVSGVTSPQTLTVTRSVNSVVKTHAIGTEVRLFKQAFYAL